MLWVILLVFIAFKIPHLYYPFYWDECWPYAVAVKQMYYNGPSLLPGAISGEVARGHPLMFHFLAALWMKIFGTSNVAMHSFPLFISVLFAIAIYEVGARLFHTRVAITAVLLIIFQQMFFVQAAFVLFEVFIAFLAFISIYFYTTRKYVLTAIALTMLFYTKESGLVLGLVLGIDAVAGLFSRQSTIKHKAYNLLSLIIPALCIGVFFLLQKKINGWYVLPLYTDGLEHSWGNFYDKFRGAVKVCFRDGYRRYFWSIICLLSIVAAYIRKNPQYLVVLIAAPFTFLLCSDMYHWLIPAYALVPLWIISVLLTAAMLPRTKAYDNKPQRKFIFLCAAFLVAFCAFTAYNLFFIDRYLLIALVPLLFIAALYYTTTLEAIHKKIWIPGLLVMLLVQGYAYVKDNNLSDISLGAFDGMYVQQAPVKYLEEHGYYNKNISILENLQWQRLDDINAGFRTTQEPFNFVYWGIMQHTDIVLLENIESNRAADTSAKLKMDTSFVLVQRVESGKAWSEIFVRKQLLKK